MSSEKVSSIVSIAVAEFLGTATLVFISCMGCYETITEGFTLPLQVMLSSGLAVMIVIHVSLYIKIP